MTTLFSAFIFKKRTERGETQQEVALRAGMTPSYLAFLEKGRRPPPESDRFERLLDALNLNEEERDSAVEAAKIDRLVGIIDSIEIATPSLKLVRAILLAAPELSDDQIDALKELIASIAQNRSGALPAGKNDQW